MNISFKQVYVIRFGLYGLCAFGWSCPLHATTFLSLPNHFDSLRAKYVTAIPKYFYLKPVLSVRTLGLDVNEKDNPGSLTEYAPNTRTYMGLGVYLFDIGLEFSFELPESDQQIEEFGETEIFDLQSNIYAKKWGGDFAYQRYKGFFVQNATDRRRPDLSLFNIHANLFYVFNHKKFSYRAAYNLSEYQKKSAGSFILSTYFSRFLVKADSAILSPDQSAVSAEGDFVRGSFTTLAIMPGYAHTFVWKQLYINLALSLGPGYQWISYTPVDDANRSVSSFDALVNFRSALGYNGKRFFGGISFFNQTLNAVIDDVEITSFSGNIKLFFGLRLKEKGILKKRLIKL